MLWTSCSGAHALLSEMPKALDPVALILATKTVKEATVAPNGNRLRSFPSSDHLPAASRAWLMAKCPSGSTSSSRVHIAEHSPVSSKLSMEFLGFWMWYIISSGTARPV
ncbi:unnamed protein product [Polarella glacialis]|uniref:Uncharacterized protein n=1 Tax=Polarella glacialis TaxID=89957 RepID=A0A813FSG0_POLGL|nr:unnamed protein product [Polarella glacialis]